MMRCSRNTIRNIYNTLRTIIFSFIALATALIVSAYILVSIPVVQNYLKGIAERELAILTGGNISIESLSITPFNEVIIHNAAIFEPGSQKACININRLGAGVGFWELVLNQNIVITYVELIGAEFQIIQKEDGEPFNVQFLIDAFSPKDKNKPPAKFDLKIGNVVIRNSLISFHRKWIAEGRKDIFDANHFILDDINADVNFPKVSNDSILIDLRRLAFSLDSRFQVDKISSKIDILSGGDLKIKDIKLQLPSTSMTVNDIDLPLKSHGGALLYFSDNHTLLKLNIKNLVPEEFSYFYKNLNKISGRFDAELSANLNLNEISIDRFEVASSNEDLDIDLEGFKIEIDSDKEFHNIRPKRASIDNLKLKVSSQFNKEIAKAFLGEIPEKGMYLIGNAGDLRVNLSGFSEFENKAGTIDLNLSSAPGDIDLKGHLSMENKDVLINIDCKSEGIDLDKLISQSKLGRIGADLEMNLLMSSDLMNKDYLIGFLNSSQLSVYEKLKNISEKVHHIDLNLNVPYAEINNYMVDALELKINKEYGNTLLELISNDENMDFNLIGRLDLTEKDSKFLLNGRMERFKTEILNLSGKFRDIIIGGDFDANIWGTDLNNLQGNINLEDIFIQNVAAGKKLTLDKFVLSSEISDNDRAYNVFSDWICGKISGKFDLAGITSSIRRSLSLALPSFINWEEKEIAGQNAEFNFKILPDRELAEYFNLPLLLLYEADLRGNVNSDDNSLEISINAPYIQRGNDKLIRKTAFNFYICEGIGSGDFYSAIPTKKGVLDLGLRINSSPDEMGLICEFNPGFYGPFYGDLSLKARFANALNRSGNKILINFIPSIINLNGAEWEIGSSEIEYSENIISVDNFSISHEDQLLSISGNVSKDLQDEIKVILRKIDLDYVFDTLNIDVAQFGGNATGIAIGKGLLSGNPKLYTQDLHVDKLSYNRCILGDGELRGDFDMKKKRVGIYADIEENARPVAKVEGGIWIDKDSLMFDFDADKVRIGFLQHYMKAFSSFVDGRASGKAHLYGTFKDVNMYGRLMADTIAIKVGYSNVVYSGSDSVIIEPGKIDIRRFRLSDAYGNTGYLSGILEHNYFHQPEFDFRLTDARNLLLYDTNSGMNSRWYGRIFGSGTGRIVGDENYVRLIADMVTEEGSDFTFVLNDSKEATNYQFLSFIDSKKDVLNLNVSDQFTEEDEIVKAFNKIVAEKAGPPTTFAMDIRATLTPFTTLNLIMDPLAGDKIIARGEGSINLGYNSKADELKMYGKYVLTEGTYNFSLQDIILKDFIIKEGSSISFNGDPMDALLNIRGAYRVNANLTDLDASFSTDKDLNRVNVPVDAMLLVNGELEHPEIKFDIELPTLNEEIAQKVRSIISSEDMMNTQMIYLLALNRFYTPDYSGNASTGGEWTSVASSTISSQLQNMIGQLTDKISVAPSVRSDKGDFTDLQVDVALSSRLFNNRLLINGNLGYRDPSISSTTLIGDFDIEYLLNRSGNFRLKAYNHFNDQNYYLKSALTTQGLGVVWRKEFDSLFRKEGRNRDVRVDHERGTTEEKEKEASEQ